MNNKIKKFKIGDLVLFAHEQERQNIGIVVKKRRRPFIENYKICWSNGKIWSEDKWYVRHGWKADGWISPYDLILFKENNPNDK